MIGPLMGDRRRDHTVRSRLEILGPTPEPVFKHPLLQQSLNLCILTFSAQFDDEFPHIDGRRAGEVVRLAADGVNKPQFRRVQRLPLKSQPPQQRP